MSDANIEHDERATGSTVAIERLRWYAAAMVTVVAVAYVIYTSVGVGPAGPIPQPDPPPLR